MSTSRNSKTTKEEHGDGFALHNPEKRIKLELEVPQSSVLEESFVVTIDETIPSEDSSSNEFVKIVPPLQEKDEEPSSSTASTSKNTTKSNKNKKGKTAGNVMSNYQKKEILKQLKENGCCAENVDKLLSSYKFNKDFVKDFLNKSVEEAQQHVHQECNSLSFDNITQWLTLFKSWNLPAQCCFEPSIVLSAIANNEEHPPPSELNGIDLKSIYEFLSNATRGLPQPELNPESAQFLAEEFEMLINEANTDEADMETAQLKFKLENKNPGDDNTKTRSKLSLDPLQLANESQ